MHGGRMMPTSQIVGNVSSSLLLGGGALMAQAVGESPEAATAGAGLAGAGAIGLIAVNLIPLANRAIDAYAKDRAERRALEAARLGEQVERALRDAAEAKARADEAEARADRAESRADRAEGRLSALEDKAPAIDKNTGKLAALEGSVQAVKEKLRATGVLGRDSADEIPVGPDAGPSLLIIEDDETTLTTMSKLFNLEGFRVAGATTAEVARQMLAKCPDAVLVDLILGGDECGPALVADAKRACPGTRVVVLTGAPEGTERLRRAREAGPDAVFFKPIKDSRLPDLFRALRPGGEGVA